MIKKIILLLKVIKLNIYEKNKDLIYSEGKNKN